MEPWCPDEEVKNDADDDGDVDDDLSIRHHGSVLSPSYLSNLSSFHDPLSYHSPINPQLPKLVDHSAMDQLLQEPLPKLPENRAVPSSSSSSSASAGRVEFNAFSNSLKSAQEVSAAFDLVIAQGRRDLCHG